MPIRPAHLAPADCCEEGDNILVGGKPVGTLVQDNLLPGKNLYLLGTGTGLAPFVSIIKDPDVYDRFEHVVLVHGCREVAELAYGARWSTQLAAGRVPRRAGARKLLYYPTVTREAFRNTGRITDLLESGKLRATSACRRSSAADDRVMLCGSPAMLHDLNALLLARGFAEGSHAEPAHYVIEKAFVEK